MNKGKAVGGKAGCHLYAGGNRCRGLSGVEENGEIHGLTGGKPQHRSATGTNINHKLAKAAGGLEPAGTGSSEYQCRAI